MKVLVTGVKGQLGYDVMKVLRSRNIDCLGADIDEFDITNAKATGDFIRAYGPDAVVHCSAYTAVDKAEENPDVCFAVNRDGPRNIAAVCKELGAKMVLPSTDYVFPGTGDKAYEVDDPTGPLSVYGKSKLAGENEVRALLDKYFVVRLSWAFGYNGHNFVRTMLKLAETHPELSVVCDQIGSPTYTADLAVLLCDMIETEHYGTYHATNEGYCSWADFAEAIFQRAGCNVKVNRVTSEQYNAKAHRPANSRLSKIRLDENGFRRLPSWQDALDRYLKELGK